MIEAQKATFVSPAEFGDACRSAPVVHQCADGHIDLPVEGQGDCVGHGDVERTYHFPDG
jgi:hypothetical protein